MHIAYILGHLMILHADRHIRPTVCSVQHTVHSNGMKEFMSQRVSYDDAKTGNAEVGFG